MAKKRPMTNAERVRKHRAEKSSRQQINLTLQKSIVAKLDRQAKQADQARSEYIATLIGSGQPAKKKMAAAQKPPVADELNTKEQQAVLHVLAQIDGDYLQQMAVDGISGHRMRRAINRMSKALQAQNPELTQPGIAGKAPAYVTSNKKKAATKRRSSKKAAPAAETMLDAIGLGRPEAFRDFPGAVSVTAEIKDFPKMNKGQQSKGWRSSPRKFMAVWEAQKHIDKFKKAHRDATVEQRYMGEDQTLIELTATYADERPDHRVVYQARRDRA